MSTEGSYARKEGTQWNQNEGDIVLSMLVHWHCKLEDSPCAICIQMIVCFLSIYAKSMWAHCPRSAPLQHSPSLRIQSKGCSEVLNLGRGQRLGEGVGHHVICGAVDKPDGALLDDPVDPMVSHVNVLCMWVVLVVTCKRNGCLVVGKQSGGGCDVAEYLRNEAV